MKERPILFSAPMVRALLNGSKTQTRRAVKHPTPDGKSGWHPIPTGWQFLPGGSERPACPYGKPGDRLWVRETWGYRSGQSTPGRGLGQATIEYRADDARVTHYLPPEGIPDGLPKQRPCRTDEDYGTYCDVYLTKYWRQWRPSIFMPRWACRIALEIVSVRVERLQDISEVDAKAEGIVDAGDGNGWQTADTCHYTGDPVSSYLSLWEFINGECSWDANPWVWVVEFKRIKPS